MRIVRFQRMEDLSKEENPQCGGCKRRVLSVR